MDSGLIGAIVGSALGIAGGALGSYCSIKNTQGPRERRFVIKTTLVCWVLVCAFLAGLFLIPRPYSNLLWIPYGIVLPLGIVAWSREQAQIRRQESAQQESE